MDLIAASATMVKTGKCGSALRQTFPSGMRMNPLFAYRVHTSSLSGRTRRTGENVQDLRRAIEINRAYLPPADADRISSQALEAASLGALRRSRRMIEAGEMQAPLTQIREVLICSHSAQVVLKTSCLLALVKQVSTNNAQQGTARVLDQNGKSKEVQRYSDVYTDR